VVLVAAGTSPAVQAAYNKMGLNANDKCDPIERNHSRRRGVNGLSPALRR
jgi:hypothetical protein